MNIYEPRKRERQELSTVNRHHEGQHVLHPHTAMPIFVALALAATLAGCSTFAPVPTGKNTYLIEGGVGLTGATFSLMASHANEFCEKKGLQMTVLEWSDWVPGRETPKLQFSCTTEAAPAQLRPDKGVSN